jgi:hypothetical protein
MGASAGKSGSDRQTNRILISGSGASSSAASAGAAAAKRGSAIITPRQNADGDTAPADGASGAGAVGVGGGSNGDLTSFYLTTGLAAVAAFWIILYTFLLTLLRKYGPEPPPTSEAITAEDRERDKKKKQGFRICGCPCGIFSFCIPGAKKLEGLRRFAYRAGRVYVFVEFWLVVGITVSVTIRALGTTPGTGLYSEWNTRENIYSAFP